MQGCQWLIITMPEAEKRPLPPDADNADAGSHDSMSVYRHSSTATTGLSNTGMADDTHKECNSCSTAPDTVLIISATDSGGCAGMQADLRVCGSLRVFAVCAVTAVTAQNTLSVEAVMSVSDTMLRQQIRCARSQHRPDAVKIGLLPAIDSIYAVADELRQYHDGDIVIDPVASATAGMLMEAGTESWRRVLVRELLPLCSLVTPNLPELEMLTGRPAGSPQQITDAARAFFDICGSDNLLVKGGHGSDPMTTADYFFSNGADTPVIFHTDRIKTANLRGTGCTLSSAIACYMARGYLLSEAVLKAHTYLQQAIKGAIGCRYDAGAGPVDHFILPH